MVNMKDFSIKFTKFDEAEGSFIDETFSLPIKFEIKKDQIFFELDDDGESGLLFEEWLLKEAEVYRKFMEQFIKKLDEVNKQNSFEGEITEEHSYRGVVEIQCSLDSTPQNVKFFYVEHLEVIVLEFDIPIPMNKKGDFPRITLAPSKETRITIDTLKRMWEPFREKTKYRLKLLHVLR